MRIKRLNGMITIATQLDPDKIGKLQTRGYRSIICNRPDFEGEDQPSFDEIKGIAATHGLEARYIPVALSGASQENHAEFARAMTEMEGPILLYCRSGTRSSTLWQAYEMKSWDKRGPSVERRSTLPNETISGNAPQATRFTSRRVEAVASRGA